MPTTEPLTGASIPVGSDAPDIAAIVSSAISGVADNTIPFFTSTALRDAAYTTFVANGGAMRNGLTCHVGATRYVYISGAWVADAIGYQTKMMLARRETDTASFPNDVWTPFSSNTNWVEDDPWGMHSTGSTVVAPWTGWYDIKFTVSFNNSTTGQRGIRLVPSAGADIGEGAGQAVNLMLLNATGGGIDARLSTSWLCRLTAGQSVDGQAFQNSGTTLTVLYVGIAATYLGPNT